MIQIRCRGVFPALTTKFTAADKIECNAMERHPAFQLEADNPRFVAIKESSVDTRRIPGIRHVAGDR